MKQIKKLEDFISIIESKKQKKFEFENIIFVTNQRDPKKNKTLNNLTEAVKGTGTKIYTFVSDEIQADDSGDEVRIYDSEQELTIHDESNVDTLVITRLGAQGLAACEEALNILQDWGFFVLNPIQPAKRASNKYATAVLLDKIGLPQPNFSLITKAVIEDEELEKQMYKDIYKDWGKNEKKDENREFVVKILDGHGGTGVFLTNGKKIKAVLQAIFAIEPEQQLLLQRKEEADGGDIRVHVLTLRNKQKIIGAMKRVKISKDFRSNVSLGATAEPVKLTKEQERIALKAAESSKLPWCAVDIMPLKKGSNPDVGDNVILELNSSPGTDGISDVMKENFMRVLLDEINDPKDFYIQEKTAGFREGIEVSIDGDTIDMLAKLDTGNGSSASTLGVDSLEIDDSDAVFKLKGKTYRLPIHGKAVSEIGKERVERITVIVDEIKIGKRKLTNVEFGLDPSRNKSTDILINRDVLKKLSYVVSSEEPHILTPKQDILRR